MAQYTKPLVIKTPYESGARVRDAQWLLGGWKYQNGKKVWRQSSWPRTFKGQITGNYGPVTAKAARDMKWLIGYPAEQCTPVFGQILYEYLTGKRVRSREMIKRAQSRLISPAPTRSYPLNRRGIIIGVPYQGTHRRGNWQSDRAYDLGVPIGTPVLAIEPGVIDSRWGYLSSSNPLLAGMRMTVNSNSGRRYYYAHNSRQIARPGQRVVAGQTIAYSGMAAGVPHLHVAVSSGTPSTYLLGGSLPRMLADATEGTYEIPEDWEHEDCVPEDEAEGYEE